MSWHSKKVKRELWIIPLILASDPEQVISRARMTYVLKALEGPREDGSVVKKVSDGDIWIKAIFPYKAISECFQGESQDEDWNRSLILIKKYRVNHEVNEGSHEFQLLVTEFSYWETQEGFTLKSNPVYCMDVPEIQRKVDLIVNENEKKNKSGERLSMSSSLALSDLVGLMSPPEDSQSAAAPKTPAKANKSNSSGQTNSLPDSPPFLNPDILLNELCVISSQERQQLDEIEEWKDDYVPPKMKHSSSSSVDSQKSDRKMPRSIENVKKSPKHTALASPKNVLYLHKRTLDTSDSSGDIDEPVVKMRKKTFDLCNGDINLNGDNQGKDVHSMSVQVGNSLFMDSQPTESSRNKKEVMKDKPHLVNTSAQVGDSLQIMDIAVSSGKDKNAQGSESDISSSRYRLVKNKVSSTNSKDCDKDSNSSNLTPIVETQAQRIPSSGNTDSTRHSGVSILTGDREASKTSTSQESRSSVLQLDTIVQPTRKQPAKNIGDYQDRIDLSCSVNDVSGVDTMDDKVDKERVGSEHRSASPDRYQSTQRPENDHQIHRPDFPVSPVPMLGESQRDTVNLPQGSAFELGSPRRPSGEDGSENGRTLNESTPKAPEDAALCVGGYFSAGISPPLVMPSTSHIPVGPASPTDLHSPLHPPAKPSSSTYTPLLTKSSARKLSPTRKSPSKTVKLPAIPSTSSEKVKPKTPVHKERRETMDEEYRLAILSGRKDLRKSIEDDVQSVSSVGTVQLVPTGRDLDIDPEAVDEEEKKIADLHRASSGIEIIDVKMKDVSPKERKLQRRPTLEITALSPKKLGKFFSSRSHSSSDSDGVSVSSSSSRQLKKFSIGKRMNTLDISLKIVNEIQNKKPSFQGPKHSKSKTPAKRKGDISVLFSSPDRLKKSASDLTPLSPDGSMIRKRKRIRLYKESMLMPVDEDASQNSESQSSSGSQSTGVQSTPDSDMLLISNSSSEVESQEVQKKGKTVVKSVQDSRSLNSLRRGKRKTKAESKNAVVVTSDDSEDLATLMTREQGRKDRETFLKESSDNLSPTLTKKLKISPRVQLQEKPRLTPSYSLTAAQRSKRRSKTSEGDEMETNSESDWTLPFTPLISNTKSTGTAATKSQDVVKLLQHVSETEEDVTDTQKQLLNIPLSLELSDALDNYLTLPKFAKTS